MSKTLCVTQPEARRFETKELKALKAYRIVGKVNLTHWMPRPGAPKEEKS